MDPVYSSHSVSPCNHCTVSLRILARSAPRLQSAGPVCIDFLLNPDLSFAFSGNYFSTARNLLAPSIASLLERLSMPWHSCRVRCALNRPAILLFARVLARYACMCQLSAWEIRSLHVALLIKQQYLRINVFFTLRYRKEDFILCFMLLLLFWLRLLFSVDQQCVH